MTQEHVPNYTILRFNFSEDIVSRIAYFSKLHQFEDRHTYKTNWNRWFEENQLILEEEIRRLNNNGYDGDAKEKMYKAGRYYFRKKQQVQVNEEESTIGHAKKVIKKNSKYTTMNKAVLEEMDNHIIASMRTDRAYTPAGGYTDFCQQYTALLLIETHRLKLSEQLNEEDISHKIKKTYKNRYFIVTR
jgi:hypothetical protein